jgi:hypothetical protein
MLLICINNCDIMVQELLKIHYPDRLNLIDAGEAWRLRMETPRHYQYSSHLH